MIRSQFEIIMNATITQIAVFFHQAHKVYNIKVQEGVQNISAELVSKECQIFSISIRADSAA